MLDMNITQESDTANYLDTARYLNDVELAETLLENGKQNDGKLSYSDIVFSLRNFLKMKYYPVAIKYFFQRMNLRILRIMSTTRQHFTHIRFAIMSRHLDNAVTYCSVQRTRSAVPTPNT